jgi:hypothetical protein
MPVVLSENPDLGSSIWILGFLFVFVVVLFQSELKEEKRTAVCINKAASGWKGLWWSEDTCGLIRLKRINNF